MMDSREISLMRGNEAVGAGAIRVRGCEGDCARALTKTEFGIDWTPEESARGYQVWGEQGYLSRVSGEGFVEPDELAQTVLYVLTRPREMMIDVIQVRAQK